MACRYASIVVRLERLLQSHARGCRLSDRRQYSTQVKAMPSWGVARFLLWGNKREFEGQKSLRVNGPGILKKCIALSDLFLWK